MTTHELKTDPAVFAAVAANDKRFEIRKDDRGFAVGDRLVLRETKHTGAEMADGAALEFTGKTCRRIVTHVMRGPCYGLVDGWALLSVRPLTIAEKAGAQ